MYDSEPSPTADDQAVAAMTTMQVHPIADLFPMLASDELAELAADIKQRGLLQPIVLDSEGKVLDGRNRLAACELAGVKPEFTTYEGDDPDGYALSVNIARRHLTVSQRAMVIARALRSSGFGRKRGVQDAAKSAEVKRQRISEATTVLDFAPDLADAVAAGTRALNDAYEVAKARRDDKDTTDAKMIVLRREASDLADDVIEEILTLDDALTALTERRAEAKLRERVIEIDDIRDDDGAPPPAFQTRVFEGALTWAEAVVLAEQWLDERKRAIARAQDSIRSVTSGWGAVRSVADSPDNPYVVEILDGLGDPDREALNRILATLNGGTRDDRAV